MAGSCINRYYPVHIPAYRDSALRNCGGHHCAAHYWCPVRCQHTGWRCQLGAVFIRCRRNTADFSCRSGARPGRLQKTMETGADYRSDKLFPAVFPLCGAGQMVSGLDARSELACRDRHVYDISRRVPSDPRFKNLTVWPMFGPGWSYKSHGKTPMLTDGCYTRTHTVASEAIVEYRFRLF